MIFLHKSLLEILGSFPGAATKAKQTPPPNSVSEMETVMTFIGIFLVYIRFS